MITHLFKAAVFYNNIEYNIAGGDEPTEKYLLLYRAL